MYFRPCSPTMSRRYSFLNLRSPSNWFCWIQYLILHPTKPTRKPSQVEEQISARRNSGTGTKAQYFSPNLYISLRQSASSSDHSMERMPGRCSSFCYLTCADDWWCRLNCVSVTADVRLFSDSPKFWLAIRFTDLFLAVAQLFKIWEGKVSRLLTTPLWVAAGRDISRWKPSLKIVDSCLEKVNINNPRFKESNRERSDFWILRLIVRRMNIICFWSVDGCMDNNWRSHRFFQWTMMLDWNDS